MPTQPPAGLVTSGDGENVPTFQVEAAELVNQEQHQQTTQADSAHVVQQTQHDGHGSLQAVTTPDANSQVKYNARTNINLVFNHILFKEDVAQPTAR